MANEYAAKYDETHMSEFELMMLHATWKDRFGYLLNDK
jgi:hypothetical protein